MRFNKMLREIQAILFASGEPVEFAQIAQAAACDVAGVAAAAEEINAIYETCGMPFEIVRLSDSLQMCARAEYATLIRTALSMKRNTPLSQAALEVLAVVAYNQPISKSFVEQVRGVDSAGVMNALAEKGLVEEAGRLDLPGRPIAYQTTANFLRCFSLESLEELPALEESDAVQEREEV